MRPVRWKTGRREEGRTKFLGSVAEVDFIPQLSPNWGSPESNEAVRIKPYLLGSVNRLLEVETMTPRGPQVGCKSKRQWRHTAGADWQELISAACDGSRYGTVKLTRTARGSAKG